MPKSKVLLAASIITLQLAPISISPTQAASEFYAGKQINLIVGTEPGGGYDNNIRVMAPFFSKHIPGNPVIVVQNIGGAGGQRAATHVYNVAPRDGTVIATTPSVILLAEALNLTPVRFDSGKFNWLGTITTLTHVLAVKKSAGVETIEDAKKKVVVLGATTATGADYIESVLANALLGTKFHIIKGYSGGSNGIALAMERDEVHGFANSWDSWKGTRPEWITENKLNYLLQIGPKTPDLPHVPSFSELVHSPKDKAMVDLLGLIQAAGRSLFAPPDVPKDRIEILRSAFDATMRDPAYVARMHELNLDLLPRKGSELQAELERVMANKEDAARNMKAILKAAE